MRPALPNLVEIVRARARERPTDPAFLFLGDGESVTASIDYRALDRQASALAAALRRRYAPGTRAVLMYGPGIDFAVAFLGCLYGGIVAVPVPHSPRRARDLTQLTAVAADADAAVVLTTRAVLEPLAGDLPSALGLLEWMATDALAEEPGAPGALSSIDPSALAYLQYTSGSTATPKGVMISHANLIANLGDISDGFDHRPDSVIVSWLPHFHDMGLVYGLLQPLYDGIRAVHLPPLSFIASPVRWLRAMSRFKGTHSGGPNFAYDLCAQRITAGERRGLDLSSWRIAFNGAEPVRPETLRSFEAAFAECGFSQEAFYPAYGLAEATLRVSGRRPNDRARVRSFSARQLHLGIAVSEPASDDVRVLVSCGEVSQPTRVAIVDPDTGVECGAGREGEIWVAGPGVAQGYWKRPDATEAVFRAHVSGTADGPYLRTGDLGFLDDGELYVIGRVKDLIIVRGQNHHPEDIESTIQRCHPALAAEPGAAFSIDVDGEERVVIVQAVRRARQEDPEPIVAAIRAAVSEHHDLQIETVVLVRAGSVPRTSSGKVKRGACRARFLENALAEVFRDSLAPASAPAIRTCDRHYLRGLDPAGRIDALQEWLQSGLRGLLRDDTAWSVDSSPAALGLDSLAAAQLKHELESAFQVHVPWSAVLGETVRGIAARVAASIDAPAAPGPAAAVRAGRREFRLSHGQRALWLLDQIAPAGRAYSVARAAFIDHALNVEALERAVSALLTLHPILRVRCFERGGVQLQTDAGVVAGLVVEDASSLTDQALQARLEQLAFARYDLAAGGLFRVHLLRRSATAYALLLAAHHIVVDLRSLAVLVEDLGRLYSAALRGETAAPSARGAAYDEFVDWQDCLLAGPDGERLWSFWRDQLAGAATTLELPLDRPRPAVQTYQGARLGARIAPESATALRELARQHDTTLFAALLAGFQALLYRYTAESDFLVGCAASGRSDARFADSVGYFVNPLVVRAPVGDDPAFETLLDRLRAAIASSLDHQDYPFALLVERLEPARDPSRPPLFQAMFVFEPRGTDSLLQDAESRCGADLLLRGIPLTQSAAQVDLTLTVVERADGLAAAIDYNTDLFEAATIERMLANWQVLLETAARTPSRRLSALDVVATGERDTLRRWNLTDRPYRLHGALAEWFEARASETPEAPAVSFEGRTLSYAELNEQANRLASCLRGRGVGTGSTVAVCLERSLDLVVALVAVVKAGAAYVPLDPSEPGERLALMVAAAMPAALVSSGRIAPPLPSYRGAVVLLDGDADEIAAGDPANGAGLAHPDNLAYVIFTSGSTGVPKGVMVSHRAICNRLAWMQEAYGLEATDGVLQKTPIGFDVSVWEFFWPLTCGARLVVARPGGHRDPEYLVDLIRREAVTTVHFVPSMLDQFVRQPAVDTLDSLRRVICSGEELTRDLESRFYARLGCELHNLYGPTEAAVDVTAWACTNDPSRARVPIGRPIANIQVYVLDRRLQQVPIGVPGQLYLSGVGLARGYVNNPAATASRFLPNPFGEASGARTYATGDIVRYRSDGQLEFLGREDGQIKIRGVRIEPGEIEAVLNAAAGVRHAVVGVDETASGKRLVAYVVAEGGASIEPARLRALLERQLPEAMIPTEFVFLDSLPLTTSGKLNRRALPVPDRTSSAAERAPTEPRTPLEALVASIWIEVLRIERLSVHDSFFALGGHSLMATQVISRVREALGVDVPLMLFFTARPTVAAFVEALEQFIIEQASDADAELAMAEIETLSDGEVQAALADEMRLRTMPAEARDRG